jgi:hypothetical protein
VAIVDALNRVLRPQNTAYVRALRTMTDAEAEADA